MQKNKYSALKSIYHDWINGFILCLLVGWTLKVLFLVSLDTSSWLLGFNYLSISLIQLYLQALQHEAVHRNLFTSRFWNDFVGQLVLSRPLFESLEQYREFHLCHHRFLLNPKKDPEVNAYQNQGYSFEAQNIFSWFKLSLLDISGWHWWQFRGPELVNFKFKQKPIQPKSINWADLIFILLLPVLIGLLVAQGRGLMLLLFWILPQMTLTFLIAKWQGFAEHPKRTPNKVTSTFNNKQNLITRLILWPLNGDRHWAHHQYPHRPWYTLRTIEVADESPVIEGLLFGKNCLRKKLVKN